MILRSTMVAALLTCAAGTGFAEAPHIGYTYPAGGQPGTSFDVILGGQYLSDAANVLISGEGVTAAVTGYAVRYELRELRGLYRRKENLEATIEERREKGEAFEKEQRQLNVVMDKLAVAELPDGIEAANKQQALRSYRSETREQFNPQIAERLSLRVSIDANAEPGERELRVDTSEGLSNPMFFEIGVLAETNETEPNDDHMAPHLQTVPVPSVINGQIRPGDIDHFRFEAREGDRLVVNVSARRIIPYLADAVPGWFQAVAALYDEDGNEVAYDDDHRFNPDPVLFYEVPETGSYTLAVRDSIYRGREDFVYRIAVGELPFITGIFPLGGQKGQNAEIILSGWNLPQNRIAGTLPDNDDEIWQVSLKKNGYRSNRMPFSIGNLAEETEVEPNDAADAAMALELPIIINGRIQEPGDPDFYSFHGEKGDTVSISIAARRLNSPLDSIIALSGPGLEKPVRNDDYMLKDTHLHLGAGLVTHHADSYVLQELPETGTYTIELRDTQSKGGPDYAYRLRISPAQPDFMLRMEPSGVHLAPGGTAVFTVTATRQEGFEGVIAIDAINLPRGFSISHAEIPADADSTRITITAPTEMAERSVSPEIIGTAAIEGETVTHAAVPVDNRMQAFLYRHLVPARELALTSVSEAAPVQFVARLPKSGIIELPLGEEVRIPLKGFISTEKRGANITCDEPPPGLSVVKGWIGRKKDAGPENGTANGQVILKAEDPLKPGDHANLVLMAISRQGRETARYPAPAIPMKVVAPRE
jgi:hypothetical protein